RKSVRKSTTVKSAATAQRVRERTSARQKRKKLVPSETWEPTQEELLEEAKITEQENLKSLEKFYQMESEKKKIRPTKKVFTGPTITFSSMTMPLIEEIPISDDDEPRRDVTHQSSGGSLISHPEFIFDDDGVVGLEVEIAYDAVEPVEIKPKEVKTKSVVTDKKCARTFLTFSNEEEFRKAFPIRKPPKVKPPQTCVFTG
ncbi:unnamed protein product, partial [Nesidiocoris tenuis]